MDTVRCWMMSTLKNKLLDKEFIAYILHMMYLENREWHLLSLGHVFIVIFILKSLISIIT